LKQDRKKKREVDVTMACGADEALISLHEARRMPVKKRTAMLTRMVEASKSKTGTTKRGQQELDFGAPEKVDVGKAT